MSHDTLAAKPSFLTTWGTNIRASGRAPGKCACGFVIAWVAFFAILWLLPIPAGLTLAGKATLAVVVWACIMWITEALPVGISGMLIPMLLVMSGAIDKFPKAASGFTTPVVFLCLAAFIFAAVMQAAGLDRRIALSLLHKMKVKTVNGVIWAMFAANLLLSLIIPAANARAATLLPVVNGITEMFGDTPEERANTRMWVRRIDLNILEPAANGFRFSQGLKMFQDRVHCIPEAAEGLKESARKKLAWLDAQMGSKSFVTGNKLTMADILLFTFLEFLGKVGQPLDPANKNLTAWMERMKARPSAAA